jgi:LacI family transcriptional regulator
MHIRPTLRDIAKATGFHFTTVGLAMRGDPRILPATAEKIRQVAADMGYTQDAMLSALSSYRHAKQSRFAGLIGYLHTYDLPKDYVTNHRSRQTHTAAENRARELGFKLEPIDVRADGLTGKRLTALLRARGIRGLVLPPLMPVPDHFVELDWDQFVTVAIGYSIITPKTYRAAFNQAYSMKLALRELRQLGYRRIGLQMYHEADVRTNGNTLGAYLADQMRQPESDRLPPLFTAEIPPTNLAQWLDRYRPDCILAASDSPLPLLKKLGLKVPEDIGFAVLSRDGEASPVAGIDEQADLLGESAVDFAVSLLRNNQHGLPQYPRVVLVESRWVWKPTLCAPAMQAEVVA